MPLRIQQIAAFVARLLVNRLAQDLVRDTTSCRAKHQSSSKRLATFSAFDRASRCTYAAASSFGNTVSSIPRR
jgi:hypothetical protein